MGERHSKPKKEKKKPKQNKQKNSA